MLLDETGPRLGLPTLQAHCSGVSRSVLGYLLSGYRQKFQEDHRLVVETLSWLRDGAVWAIDHSQPPCAIEGTYTQILAIRDLGSGMQLAWTPVVDATADNALALLKLLVAQHGAPLVLKNDNGSAFASRSFSDWIAEQRIVHLFSPVRMPRYNGACEAGIGGMKRRTEQLAARNDRVLDWTCDDLYAAMHWANDDHYPIGVAGGAAASRFAARVPLDDTERASFQFTVDQSTEKFRGELCTQGHPLSDKLSAICHRRAVRHALVEHDYLSITRRSIPQSIRSAKCARIT